MIVAQPKSDCRRRKTSWMRDVIAGSLSLFNKTRGCANSSRKLTTVDIMSSVKTFQPDYSGLHGAGLLAVLTCSGGAQEHVIELHLWNSRFAPVSSPVMILHIETFDAMFTPTLRGEVSHPVRRPSVVVRDDRDPSLREPVQLVHRLLQQGMGRVSMSSLHPRHRRPISSGLHHVAGLRSLPDHVATSVWLKRSQMSSWHPRAKKVRQWGH